MSDQEILISQAEMPEVLDSLAGAVIARHGDLSQVALVGIQRRGADLAERLKKLLDERSGRKVPLGKLDINLYRDDWTSLSVQPKIQCTEIHFDISDYVVILVDDVLFTGRTIRAALEAILDFGRPRRVELLVLVDRGNRELPIQPDYAGRRVETEPDDHVNVFVKERDQSEGVVLNRAEGGGI